MYTKVLPLANTIGLFLPFLLFLGPACFVSQRADSRMVRKGNSDIIEIVRTTFNKGGDQGRSLDRCVSAERSLPLTKGARLP